MVKIGAVQLPASKKRLAGLGERLASGGLLPGDQELYVAFLDAYDQVQQATRSTIESIDWFSVISTPLDVTGRTKTRDTLIQKLRRSPQTKLPYIRDIAGVRIVGDFPLFIQQAIAQRLLDALGEPDETVIDRLSEPASGYRALHVVARVDGIPVEIQVRTRLQHLWAEVYERVADRWGRQIRYGEPPDPEPSPQKPGPTRTDIVELLQEISLRDIADFEKAKTLPFALSEALRPGVIGDHVRPALGLDPKFEAVSAERLGELRAATDPVLESIDRLAAQLEGTLLKLAELLDEEEEDRSTGSTLEPS